eukprot:scaffold14202_cov20-Prasinocladus_malaysianus.AAC.1
MLIIIASAMIKVYHYSLLSATLRFSNAEQVLLSRHKCHFLYSAMLNRNGKTCACCYSGVLTVTTSTELECVYIK